MAQRQANPCGISCDAPNGPTPRELGNPGSPIGGGSSNSSSSVTIADPGRPQTNAEPASACDIQRHCYVPDPESKPDGTTRFGVSAGGATVFTSGSITSLPAGRSVASHVGFVTFVAIDNSTLGPLVPTSSSLRELVKDVGEYALKVAAPGPGATIKILSGGKQLGNNYYIPLGTFQNVQVPDHTPLRFSFAVEGNQITAGVIVHRGYYIRGP